jgi:hypothetical protein
MLISANVYISYKITWGKYIMMTKRDIMTNRCKTLKVLKQYYLDKLCEDPFDGTIFDLNVLDAIEKLQEKYGEKE